MRNFQRVTGFVLGLVLSMLLVDTSHGTSTVSRHVFGVGGVSEVSATHAIRGTLGQSIAGNATGSRLTISAGFWVGVGNLTSDASSTRELPVTLALGQPQPNPFRGTTSTILAVPSGAGTLIVDIYDSSGRSIRSLLRGEVSAGYHVLEWDGLDERHNLSPSGMFFYVVRSGDEVKAKKVVLLR